MQVRKTKGMIFLSIIDLFPLLVHLLLLKYLHVYPAYDIECLVFNLDQTLSHERVLCRLAIQQNPTHKKG